MDLAELVTDRTPAGIAATLARLIRSGEIAADERMPTVRDVAAQLRVSPGTVSGAWHALAEAGLVRTRGRAGTFVLSQRSTWLPPRYRDLAAGDQVPYRIDLSSGTPDPQLLPPLGVAFARLARRTQGATTSSYLGPALIAPLERRLRADWPFVPEALTVVDGAMDGLSRVLELRVSLGSRVAVENPSFPPFYDLLDHLGAQTLGVDVDEHGMRPDGLARVLDDGPGVVLLQPRAHNPTGASLTAARAAELADVLRRHPRGRDVLVVEDDHSGSICQAPDVSLGTHLPGQVVHVRSFSKSHGPDLRIAAMSAPADLMRDVVARRMLGPGWTSRMLQEVLLELLTDSTVRESVAQARNAYALRQREVSRAVRATGAELRAGDGINMWLPVTDERAATVHLAALGIRCAPGAPFTTSTPSTPSTPRRPGGHLRISLGQVRHGYEEVGTALGVAAQQR